MVCCARLTRLEGVFSAILLALLAAVLPACVGTVEPAQSGPGLESGTTGGAGMAPVSGTGGNTLVTAGTGGSNVSFSATGGAGTGGAGTGGAQTGGASTGGAFGEPTATGGASAGGAGGTIRPGQPDAGVAADATSIPSDAGATTWTEVYSTLLNNVAYTSNCSGAACHNPGTAKNIKLSTTALGYTSIRALVTPGSTTGGNLVRVLMSGSMPRGRPKMPPADLTKIQNWIAAGALNN